MLGWSEDSSMLRNGCSIRGQIPHVLRIICLLVVCALTLDCFHSHDPYPYDWPKIRESSDKKCNNISGIYSDLNTLPESVLHLTKTKYSLAGILFSQHDPQNPASFRDGTKFDRQTSYTEIVQSDQAVDVKLKSFNKETIREKTLIIGKDINCTKDGFHISGSAYFVGQEGFIVSGWENYNILVSEDGSLIVNVTSAGLGCYGIIIPLGGSDSHYLRFERWRYK